MKMLNIFLIIILVLFLLFFMRNWIVKTGIQHYVQMVTGLRLDIGQLDISINGASIKIMDFKLHNPVGFADPLMADISEIDVQYVPAEMLMGRIHLKQLQIVLKELSIIRQDDQFNYEALGIFQKNNSRPVPLTVDDFKLDIGRVVYKDFHQHPALIKTYNLNISEHYTMIQGSDELNHLIILGVLDKTSVLSLIKANLNKLKNGLSGAVLKSLQVSDSSIKGLVNGIDNTVKI